MQKIPIIEPSYGTSLVSLLYRLEKLRNGDIAPTTPPWLFFDLKEIMHLIESVASARIEGNRTTLTSAARAQIDKDKNQGDEIKELFNIREAILFIEKTARDARIDNNYIKELHRISTSGLNSERNGSKSPGEFRKEDVKISKSALVPPSFMQVSSHMDELVQYINKDDELKFDIIKTAIAHHRFSQIHPFDDGNGRTARLLTYAMLVKYSFIDDKGMSLLNPSAIFCIDRNRYYEMLEKADTGLEENYEAWTEYVAEGIFAESERIAKLMDEKYTTSKIILPALNDLKNSGFLSQIEYQITEIAIKKGVFQASDIKQLFGVSASAGVAASRAIKKLRESGIIMVHPKYKKKYVLRFANNNALPIVMHYMGEAGLLPIKDSSSE